MKNVILAVMILAISVIGYIIALIFDESSKKRRRLISDKYNNDCDWEACSSDDSSLSEVEKLKLDKTQYQNGVFNIQEDISV